MKTFLSAILMSIAIFIAALLGGCSGGSGDASTSTGSGAVTAKLVWPQASASKVTKAAAPAAVTTVRVIITATGMTTIQQDYAAADNGGSISNIPAGTGRTFTFQGINASSTVTHQAVVSNVTITAGQTTDLGSITMLVAASLLPDTGITSSQCYKAGSDTLVSCSDADAIALNDQQDGMITPGTAGMSYSAVGAYPLTSCVKDNKTGLIWEGKTDDGGLRDKDNTYTNYGDNRAGDASAYVAAVNATSLCGYTDWRLPTADELQMIVDYSIAYPGPTINSTWFPNTVGSVYWSASPYAGGSYLAWYVSFGDGYVDYGGNRYGTYYVRLVRAGQ